MTMEGWMVRYGRRKIGRAFFHKRYFVLESTVLAYYKRQPSAKEVPSKSLPIDGNCRVEDRGLETHHGQTVYVLSIYNKKDRSRRLTMAAYNVQDACAWKEALEQVIDKGNSGKSQADDDEDKPQHHHRHRTVGNGPPESIHDWSRGMDPRWGNLEVDAAISARKRWHLVRCQNGLRFFEEVQEGDQSAQSRWKAMKAVGVVDASCADIFELIMGIDETRYEWDCTFQDAHLVQEVDGHTTILYERLQLDFLPMFLWPRDVCYLRYWRRNDDGSYVILFRSQEHPSCPPQPGCVRAYIENGGFTISPLKSRANGENRARVQQLVHIDLKGWGANYIPFCHHHSVIQMLSNVAGLREWFAQKGCTYNQPSVIRIAKLSTGELRKRSAPKKVASLPDMLSASQSTFDESEFEDKHVQYFTDSEAYLGSDSLSPGDFVVEPPPEKLDFSMLSGNLSKGDHENGRNCWSIPASGNFRVRSKRFLIDRSKTAAGEPLMQLVAVDWFKDTKRIDHVAKRKGCVAQVAAEKGLFTVAFNVQVPAASHYSMIFYFVAPKSPQGSLLQRFVDGDDNFRNCRLKLIPSVPKGSWIVRQSVGTTPCILGKAVDITYHRGPKYLEVDVDIGSSTVANGVLGLVFGVVSALVVDMAFLIQGNGMDELPERLIGAVRVSHLSLASAISPPPEAD